MYISNNVIFANELKLDSWIEFGEEISWNKQADVFKRLFNCNIIARAGAEIVFQISEIRN